MTIRSGTVARRRTLFQEASEIIEREYAQQIELDDVARRLATSRRQLQRAFAEAGATSFRTHVAKVRMRRALELLREGNLAVRDVANSVGYRQRCRSAGGGYCPARAYRAAEVLVPLRRSRHGGGAGGMHQPAAG